MCRNSFIFQIFLKSIRKNPHSSEGGNKISTFSQGGNVSALRSRTSEGMKFAQSHQQGGVDFK